MPDIYTTDELEVLARKLLREKPQIAKECLARSLQAFGLARDQAPPILAEAVYDELSSRKFELAHGRLHEYEGKQAFECYVPYNDGRGEVLIYVIANAVGKQVELYSAQPAKKEKIA